MPGKNIVICSDGTGNYYSGIPSNVRRLYSYLEQGTSEQVACYHPGVGTHPLPQGRTRLGRTIRHVKELCVGAGVIPNVINLYAYLMAQYEPGDRVYLFGFSRGAFTVRALAGMLHVCGLLRREDVHLLSFAAGLYQTSEARIRRERHRRGLPPIFDPAEGTDHASFDLEARDFKALVARPCPVRFMGVWDTVKAYGWLYPPSFPALRHNASVERVRHAVSLHERRAVFKVTGWGDRHAEVKEVWFAGDHSDVGGGHPHGNSPLADASLRWMLGEAAAAGLRLDRSQQPAISALETRSADASRTDPHDLRARGYWLIDWLPRVELFNGVYPPMRRLRVLWADGTRKPSDHAERGTPLRFHWTLCGRDGRDPALARARRSGDARLNEEPDRPIAWAHEATSLAGVL